MKKKLLIFLLLSTFCGKNSNDLKAQTPFNPNTYSGWVSTPTNSFATIPMASGATFTQVTRGSGNTFSTASDGINSSKWNNASANAAITANQFLTFSVSSNTVTSLEIDSLILVLGRSGAGPDSCILQYKIASAGSNFTAFTGGVRVIVTPGTTLSIVPAAPISLSPNDTLVFRLVAWHATSTLGTMKLMNNTTVYGKELAVVTNSISSPLIQTPNATCVSAIQGDSVQVTFNSTGVFNAGNTYSLELSDASGSFSTPSIIGNITSNLNNGTIQGAIPPGTASSNYRLRITSSDPAINGLDTTQLFINPGMILNASITQPNCPDSTGEIALTITGGSGLIQYNWSNGGSMSNVTDLAAGTYTVNITDAAGCLKDSVFSIQSIPGFLIANSITDVACHSDSTGSIQVSVSGGTTPYSILWSGNGINQTGLVANNLISGTYSVNILDANNCPYTNAYLVTEPDEITAVDSIVNVNCSSGSSGSIHLSVNGGAAPYSISWSGNGINQTGIVASNLSSGNYNVMILDAYNCVFISDYTVTEPTPINSSASVVHAACSTCTGTITVDATGGVSPYSFLWDDNSTSQMITAAPGQYCVAISDAHGCEIDTCFTISSTAGIENETGNSFISVFPNPASDVFQISFLNYFTGIKKEVLILNSLGEVVLKETIDSTIQQITIPSDQWSNGIYNYQIRTENGVFEAGKISIIR
jgi:hypothetical protein